MSGEYYDYTSKIKTLDDMNVVEKGKNKHISNTLNTFNVYKGALTGESNEALMDEEPLGNLYFMDTGTECVGPGGNEQDLYTYCS